MKRIGVISDTHLNGYDAALEEIVSRHLSDVDLVIHAGDLVRMDVLDIFTLMNKEVLVVCGNMDGADVRHACPALRSIHVENVTIGVIHGWGSPVGIRQRIMRSFQAVDCIIYGHTHTAYSGYESGIYFFNPGSPVDSRFTSSRSVGIITVDDDKIQGELIPV